MNTDSPFELPRSSFPEINGNRPPNRPGIWVDFAGSTLKMERMTRLPKLQQGILFVLMLLMTGAFQGCSAGRKDPFTLTTKSVEENNGPADVRLH